MRNLSRVGVAAFMVAIFGCGGSNPSSKSDSGVAGAGGKDGAAGAGAAGADTGSPDTVVDQAMSDGAGGSGDTAPGDTAATDAPWGVDTMGPEVAPEVGTVGDVAGETAPPPCVPLADKMISDVAGQSGRPALAWNGNGYGVAWPDDRGGTPEIFLARLDRTGASLGAQGALTAGDPASNPNLVWAGDAYGFSYVTDTVVPPHVYFVRVSVAGALMAPVGDSNGAGISSLVWTGKQYAAAYHSTRGDAGAQPDIFVTRYDALGARIAETQLTNEPGASFIPSIAWTGTRLGVAFLDSRTGAGNVFVGLLDENGAKIGTEASVTPNGGGAASIAASPTGFAVTYGDATGGKLIRLDLDGKRVGTDVPIGGAPAKIVWTGTRYAFAWSAAGKTVHLATIDTTAPAASSPLLVSDANAAATVNAVSLVWNGNGYGVAWRDERGGDAGVSGETHFAIVCPP